MANKSDLIKNVAKETGLTKKNADLVVDAVFNSIQDALADGKKVQLIGFGTFEEHVQDAILKPAKLLKFQLLKYQPSNLVRH